MTKSIEKMALEEVDGSIANVKAQATEKIRVKVG
jgi:hypothetical protein